jgi:hypothetical protein
MSLSIYDPQKGCFVLKQFKPETVNAFHPDYMKTHHPDFMREFRTIQANQEERASKAPRKHVKVFTPKAPKTGIRTKANQRMTMAEVTEELLKKTNFHIYSKARVSK